MIFFVKPSYTFASSQIRSLHSKIKGRVCPGRLSTATPHRPPSPAAVQLRRPRPSYASAFLRRSAEEELRCLLLRPPPLEQELRRWVAEEQHPAAYSALPHSKTTSASTSFPSRAVLLVLRSSSSQAPARTAPPHKLDAVAHSVAANRRRYHPSVADTRAHSASPLRRSTWCCCCFRWSSPLKIRRHMKIQFAVFLNI
jgi:hypothetical protein